MSKKFFDEFLDEDEYYQKKKFKKNEVRNQRKQKINNNYNYLNYDDDEPDEKFGY